MKDPKLHVLHQTARALTRCGIAACDVTTVHDMPTYPPHVGELCPVCARSSALTQRERGTMVIRVVNDFPPIPHRRWDWCAFIDGEEERQEYGYGRTKWEALRALIDTLEDHDG